jgi:hypothetical protein
MAGLRRAGANPARPAGLDELQFIWIAADQASEVQSKSNLHCTVRLLAGAPELSDDQCAALERSVARRRRPRSAKPKRALLLVRGPSYV